MKIAFNIATFVVAAALPLASEATNKNPKTSLKQRSLLMPEGVETFIEKAAFEEAISTFLPEWTVSFSSDDADLASATFGFSGPAGSFGLAGFSCSPYVYDDDGGIPRTEFFTGSELYNGLGNDQVSLIQQCQEMMPDDEVVPEDVPNNDVIISIPINRRLNEDPVEEYCQCLFDDRNDLFANRRELPQCDRISQRRRAVEVDNGDFCYPPFPEDVLDAFLENKIVNIVGEGTKAQFTVRNNILPILVYLFELQFDNFRRRLQFGVDFDLSDDEVTEYQRINECEDGCVNPGMLFTDTNSIFSEDEGPLAWGADFTGLTEELTIIVFFDTYWGPPEIGSYTVPAGFGDGFIGM